MKTDRRKQIFIRCCYGYSVSGMAVLVIGAILPSVIAEAGISFLAAGGLLSVMAAVSYTHLDVYKRQFLNCAFILSPPLILYYTYYYVMSSTN